MSSSRAPLLVLLLLIVTFAASAVADHALHHQMPDMIQASYLLGAIDLMGDASDTVRIADLGGNFSTQYYPPLYMEALAVALRLAGLSYGAVLWLNLPLAFMALLAVYAAGRLGGDRWSGMPAVLVLWASPGFRDAAAGVYLDFAMTCFCAVGFAFFAAFSERRGRVGWLHLVGWALAVAAGLLCRWTYAVFVAALGLAALLYLLPGPGVGRWRALRGLLGLGVATAIGMLPFGWWLLTRADLTLLKATPFAEAVELSGAALLAFYPRLVASEGLGWGLAGLVCLALVQPALWRSRQGWALVLWLLCGFAFLTWLPPKQPRYMLYLLPAAALLLDRAISGTRSPRWRRLLVTLTVVMALGTGIWHVFSRPAYETGFYERILADIDTAWPAKDHLPARILVDDNHYPKAQDFNHPVLSLQNALAHKPYKQFLPPFYASKLLYGGECVIEGQGFQFLIFAYERERLDEAGLARLPAFTCLGLDLVGAYDLRPFNGRNAEVRLYRVTRQPEARAVKGPLSR